MSSINDELQYDARAFQGSTYKLFITTILEGRKITKHCLNELDESSVDDAVRTVTSFLAYNPRFCATFNIEPLENLREKIRGARYLTINGLAVCLVQGRGREEMIALEKPEYKDKYFSENLLEHPVKCTEGHLLERESAVFWVKKYGDLCPAGSDHRIGPLVVDHSLEEDIIEYKEARRQQEQRDEERYGHRENVRHLDSSAIGGAVGKLILKVGGKAIGKNIAKIIPFVSLVMGVGLAAKRVMKGEIYRAGGEVLSGVAACFPGLGTVASVAIDVALVGEDIREATMPDVSAEIELAEAYEALGINIQETPNPTKEQVDHAYRTQMSEVESLERATDLGAALTAIRNSIYAQRGWSV